MSGVTSKDTSTPTTRKNAPLEPGGFSGFSVGTFGLVVSLIFWIIGARWTIDGLIVIFNTILNFLTIPYQAHVPTNYIIYGLLCPVPIILSAVEWRFPFERVGGEWYFAKLGAWVVWAIAGGFDLYTTYLGLGVDPGPESVTFMRELSASGFPRIIAASALTVGPEWLGRGMLTILRKVFSGRK
ncbi:MAG: hypothetical protein WCK70_02910 [Chloroflexales bacterium]